MFNGIIFIYISILAKMVPEGSMRIVKVLIGRNRPKNQVYVWEIQKWCTGPKMIWNGYAPITCEVSCGSIELLKMQP